ncbi:Uma2 family endonuclease [Tolypothrix sp. FACHB-123]|nr:Uma2 family endonuclease [Tolypothrix sp. FACHB-123]
MTKATTARLYSFQEYLAYNDGTDNRYELVDGKLELMNPPTFRHLLISKFIELAFDTEINRLMSKERSLYHSTFIVSNYSKSILLTRRSLISRKPRQNLYHRTLQ